MTVDLPLTLSQKPIDPWKTMVTRSVTSRLIRPTISRVVGGGVAGSGVSGSGVSDEVSAWVARVVSNGGTVSGATQVAARAFVESSKANEYWSLLNRVNLFAGSNLAACLTPLLIGDGSAAETNMNFVGGDYSESTGLAGNGTTKALNTGLSPADLGKDDNFMAVYVRSEATEVVRAYFGVGVNGEDAWNRGTGSATSPVFARNSTSAAMSTGIQKQYIGIQGMRRGSSANFDLFDNATIVNSVTASNATASSLPIYVLARNADSGAFWNGACAGYVAGAYLDNTKFAAFRTDWEAFQDALGRGVL